MTPNIVTSGLHTSSSLLHPSTRNNSGPLMIVGSNSGAGNGDVVEVGDTSLYAVPVEVGVGGSVSVGVIELGVMIFTTVGVDVSLGFFDGSSNDGRNILIINKTTIAKPNQSTTLTTIFRLSFSELGSDTINLPSKLNCNS